MDFILEEIQKTVPDLFVLCDDIQKQMSSKPNRLIRIKKQIKQYFQENGQAKKQINDKRSTLDQQQLANISSSQVQINRSQVRHLSQPIVENKKTDSYSELDTPIPRESFQEIPINENLQIMILKFIKELHVSEVLVQKSIKGYNGDPSVYLGQSNPVLLNFDQILSQILMYKMELNKYSSTKLSNIFDELYNYYTDERLQVEDQFKQMLHQDEIDPQNNSQIEQIVKQLLQNELLQISAPFIESSLVNSQNFQKFLTQNSQYEIQRIAIELIQPCQKNLIIYLMNRFLLNNYIKPSIVVKVKELLKDKKTYTYFLITPNTTSDSLINIEEYSFDSENNLFIRDGDAENNINLEQFISHILSSIFTLPLESFLPNYAVNTKGDLFRVFNQIQSKDGKIQHSALRNPIFFYKEVMSLQLNESFFQELFKQEHLLQFFKCLKLIIDGQKNDYHLKDKNGQYSLYLNNEQYHYIFSVLQRINQAFMWVKEVILPTQGFFCIRDIISKVYPIINEFISNNKQKTLKEYKEFMKKISIEEYIQKLASKRSLQKYKEACKSFDENLKIAITQKGESLDYVLKLWLQQINLSNISSPKYKLTLIYFASSHYLFFKSSISDQAILDQSWKQEESWENALNILYSDEHFDNVSFNPSIFIELLAIFFGINIKKYEKCFESIKYFEETEENFQLLDQYFAHKKLLGDKFYPEKETLFEKSLKYKKFKLAMYLQKQGEGKKLHNDTLIKYLVKANLNKQYFADISEIISQLMSSNKQLVLDYQWNHIWNNIFTSIEDDPKQQETTSQNRDQEEQYMHVYCTNFGERKIPKYIWEQAFQYNEKTQEFIFRRKDMQQQTSHLVGYYCLLKTGSEASGTILVEHATRYPGLNYMKDSLMKKFIPSSRLRKEFVKIQDQYYYFSHFNSTINSLSSISEKGPFQLYENIDREQLSDRIILEMIIYPESNPISCFLSETQLNSKLGLIDIGQSEILVQNIGVINGEFQLYVKSILFCMFEMNLLIPTSVIDKYANINSFDVLKEWLLDISKHQDDLIKISQYKFKQGQNIFQEQQDKISINYFNNCEPQFYFGIPIQKEAIKHLLERLVTIVKVMKWCKKKNTSISHQELFKIVDKELASIYEQINNDQQTFLEKRYSQILQKNIHLQTFNTVNMASMFQAFSEKRRGDITTIDQLLSQFKQIGPTQALEKIKKFIKIITTSDNESEYHKAYNLKNIKQFSFFNRNILFKYISQPAQEEQIIKFLQEQKLEKPIDYLNLSNCTILNSKLLKQFQLERIQTLILSNTKIADSDLVTIADSYKSLVYLDISNCDDIHYIGYAKPLTYLMSSQIVFPSLKTLVANNMKNLWILDVSGSHIQNISVSDSLKLTYFFINCPQIKKLQVQGCKQLMNELIVMYVLEGISIQLDEITSDGKFEKAIQVIRGSKGNFMQSYQAAINEIYYEQHYNDNVSIKDNLIVLSQAFTKRDLQHVFPKNFVTNVIGNLFNSKKANKQINDEFFRFMFKFFQKNPHIKDVDFKSICQEKKPITFLNIFYESLNSNDKICQQYDSYIFNNIDLDDEECQVVAKIIQKTKKEGISLQFTNVNRLNQDKSMQEVLEAISSNKITYTKIAFEKNDLSKSQIEILKNMFINFNGRIQQLKISHCNLDNSHLITLCEGLKQLKYLRVLDLSGNYISPKSFEYLTPCFDSFQLSFQTLILDDNNLCSDDFEKIQQWKYIKFLQIRSCFLSSNQITNLQQYLCSNQECKLTHLNLSQNKLTPHAFSILSEVLKRNTTLKELGLSKTIQDGTQEACLNYLVEGLKQNNNLTLLDISQNKIQDEGFIIIFNFLKEENYLRQLKILEDNSFSLEIINSFLEFIKHNSIQLKQLELSPRPYIIEFDDIYQQILHQLEKNTNVYSMLRSRPQDLFRNKSFTNSNMLDYKQEAVDFCRLGLSIDGGGMRGIIPATMIKVLCEETKYKVHEIFETVGGTSIGGLLALGSTGTLDGANPILDMDQMVNVFKLDGANIFNTSKLKAMLNNLMDQAKYDPAGLESVLFRNFQNCKLSDVIKGTNVIVTAVRREMNQGKSIAKVFRSREAIFNDDKNFYMRDVARATSAAPTFFPSAEIKNINQTKSYSLVDGGVGQNNPSKLVLEDIKKEALNSGNENNFFLLSLGTGEPKKSQQLSKNAGLLNVVNIIDSLGEGASAYVDIELKQNYGDKYLRIQPQIPISKSDAELDSIDPKIVEIYQQTAENEARLYLCEQSKYGPFNDRPIVDWFAENTQRKKDVYI
ncbi:patatin-like phospholipase family protein (macronuclear) [Tetrahymena thermophila SB210]|uniref:Patatin-like phospholipase family protein n=1 Tax=Tetrahymena thermophila (strain SB210) TaxID=312017 RepID=Q24BX9_TETTS|nr:patatin-like phospholipase family protein [Tetrahymena thermophila SB210]EAS05258.2 patatin-like phospholipase family protein [Tetrahymena thermophila SB210]|eukprot:XP_001025503.2 patatin-like phospholipase family protein [Tetrahymena thermophila SB210]